MSERTTGPSGKRRLAIVGMTAVGATALVAILTVGFLAFHARPAYGSGTGPGGGCYGVTTTGPACTFKNHVAYVDFQNFGADGCSFSDTYVQAFESLTSPGHAAAQMVYIALTEYDCYGNVISSADNYDPNTGAPAFTGSLQFGSQLSSATLSGTATMFDYATGTPFTSTVNVTWQGYGPTTTFIDSSHFRAPGFFENTHYTGSSRGSKASGSITDATGTNTVTMPTLNAELSDNSSGTVQISRS